MRQCLRCGTPASDTETECTCGSRTARIQAQLPLHLPPYQRDQRDLFEDRQERFIQSDERR